LFVLGATLQGKGCGRLALDPRSPSKLSRLTKSGLPPLSSLCFARFLKRVWCISSWIVHPSLLVSQGRSVGGLPAVPRERLLVVTVNKAKRYMQLTSCRLYVAVWHDKGSFDWTCGSSTLCEFSCSTRRSRVPLLVSGVRISGRRIFLFPFFPLQPRGNHARDGRGKSQRGMPTLVSSPTSGGGFGSPLSASPFCLGAGRPPFTGGISAP